MATFTQQLYEMNILFLLIGISIIIAIGFLIGFLWAIKSGQYKDDYTPSVRMLHDNNFKRKQ